MRPLRAVFGLAIFSALMSGCTADARTRTPGPDGFVETTISAATPTASDLPTTATTTTQPKPSPIDTAAEAREQAAAISAGEFVLVPERKIIAFPEWSGSDLNGNLFTTSSLAGSKTLVNFWASWCGPCREEWPLLQAASQAHPDVRFVGINTQDSLARAKAWLADHPTTYVHAFDDRAFIKASLTTVPGLGLPITLILDSKERIYAWFSGPVTEKALVKILS